MPEGGVDLGRRKALKTFGFLGVGGVAGKVIPDMVSFEQNLMKEGTFSTQGAVWQPVYENWHGNHEDVIRNMSFTSELDAISFEGFGSNTIRQSADGILKLWLAGQESKPYRMIPDDVLEKVAAENIKVLFGDVDYEEMKPTVNTLKSFRFGLGIGLFGAGYATDHMTRRQFLKRTGQVSILIGAGLSVPQLTNLLASEGLINTSENDQLTKRVVGRLVSAASITRPEDLNKLFREVVQANKLLESAKHLSPKTGKPHIAYSWHMAHRGIEDWLFAGQDITRKVILAFPDAVLKSVASSNADPTCLYGMRVIGVGENKKAVSDETIEDVALKDQLKQRKIIV